MQTDELIHLISQDAKLTEAKINPLYGLAIVTFALLVILAIVSWATNMGIRADYLDAIGNLFVILKQLLPFILALALFPLIKHATRPEFDPKSSLIKRVLPYILVMAALFIWSWLNTPSEQIAMAITGKSRMKCLMLIPLISLPIYAALVQVLRQGAPANPMRAGLAAGLFAGALSAVLYAFICTEDAPLFYALWYSAGIAIAGAIGAIIGRLYLKW